MLVDFFSLLILYLSIMGFSAQTKKFLFNNSLIKIYNLDFFYGLFSLSLIAIFLNFFFPLKIFSIIFLILGLILFFKNFKNKTYQINLISLLSIFITFVFIFKINGLTYDSALYHLQTLNWISNSKISFGLSNLEPRYGINSLWHIFISFLNIDFLKIKFLYLFNYIPLAVFINQLFQSEDKSFLAEIYLFLTISFILTFAILHPLNNGVMLNLIGSPEVDTVAMICFALSLYLFLKSIKNYDKENINLLYIVSSLAVLIKISHLSAAFFAIIIFFSHGKINFFSRHVFFIILINIFWFLRSVILSGCLIFPASKTCFKNLYWSHPIENVILSANAWTSFSRDTRLRLRASDFDHTIYSFDWVKPWIDDYLLNTSFFKAMFATILISLFIIIIKKKFKLKNYRLSRKIFFLIPIYIFSFYIWFKNPEIRLGYGPLVTISTIVLAISLYGFFFEKFFFRYSKLIISILLIFLIFKNNDNTKLFNVNDDKYSKNYEFIKEIQNSNGIKIFSPADNQFCYDFSKICVIEKNNDYKIEKYYGYNLFLRN